MSRFAFIIVVIALLLPGAVAHGQPTVGELVARGDAAIDQDGDYLASLQAAAGFYEQAARRDPEAIAPLIRLARTCLELGDYLPDGGLPWYERGATTAEQALAIDDGCADAHFLYAANSGNAAEALPFWRISPAIPARLERHRNGPSTWTHARRWRST